MTTGLNHQRFHVESVESSSKAGIFHRKCFPGDGLHPVARPALDVGDCLVQGAPQPLSRIGSSTSLASAVLSSEGVASGDGSKELQRAGAPSAMPATPTAAAETSAMLTAASVSLPSSKPLMMFKGCPRPLGATILLKVRASPVPPRPPRDGGTLGTRPGCRCCCRCVACRLVR